MRKKILSVMLSITMMAGLVACGGGCPGAGPHNNAAAAVPRPLPPQLHPGQRRPKPRQTAGRQRAVRLLQKQQGITRSVS